MAGLARRPPAAPREALDARYLAHNVPGQGAAGALCVLRAEVENRGTGVWLRDPPDGHHAGLAVFVDGALVGVGRAGRDVAPGERATFPVVVTWPDRPGRHQVRLDMMISGRTWFSAAGAPPLETPIELLARDRTRTEDLMGSAQRHNPWFFSPGLGVHRTREGEPAFPLFAESAKGAYVRDVDGREYVDLVMGWGTSLLGHADDRVGQAVARSLDSAALPTLAHRLEVEVSRALCDGFGFGDQVLFGKNGSDVTTWAVRAARAATGRRTIVFAGYGGWQDWSAALRGFAESAIPAGPPAHTLRVRYGDQPALETAVAAHSADLAGVFIEPAATAKDLDDPYHERDGPYLHRAEELARRHGALFIMDEIFTGFRFRQGSAQRHYGLTPDLTCLGKALANGMPLSALAGRNGVLGRSVERILYLATYRGEAHSFAAALEALRIYREEDVAERLWAAGDSLRSGVEALCRENGLPARLAGPPYRMYFAFGDGSAEERVQWRTLLQQELARHGVISHKGYVIPSVRHDGRAIARCLDAFAAALAAVARARAEGSALPYLDIPDVLEELGS